MLLVKLYAPSRVRDAVKHRVEFAVIACHALPSASLEEIGLRIVVREEVCGRLGNRNATEGGRGGGHRRGGRKMKLVGSVITFRSALTPKPHVRVLAHCVRR